MRAIACHKRLRECHLSVDTSCKACGVLALCACSNHTDRDLDRSWATPWWKGSSVDAIVCVATIAHSQWKSLVTYRPLQWPHWWAECNLSVDTSCKAHSVLDLCACSNRTDRAWHACWTSYPDHMAWPISCVAIVHICRFCFIYCGLRFYAQSHSGNGHVHATFQQREDRLQQQRQAMKDNYDQICSENWQLNALFTRQQKQKEKRRARDEARKEARDKARVEEEECQAVRDKCDKRWWQDMQFEQFLDYKRKVLDTPLAPFHSISWHTFSSVCTQLSWFIKHP